MAERSRPKQYKIRKMACEFIYQKKGLGLQVGPNSYPACVSYSWRVRWMSTPITPQGSCVRGLVLSYSVGRVGGSLRGGA